MADLKLIDDDYMECPDCHGMDDRCPVCDGNKLRIDEYLAYLKNRIEYRWRMYEMEQKKYRQLTGKSYEWFK